MTLRRGDIVEVRTGDDRPKKKGEVKRGKVLHVDRARGRVLIEGVNYVWKHLRRSQAHPHGARVRNEAPMAASNVMLVCPSCNGPRRVRDQRIEGGKKKVRLCRRCGKEVTYEA